MKILQSDTYMKTLGEEAPQSLIEGMRSSSPRFLHGLIYLAIQVYQSIFSLKN